MKTPHQAIIDTIDALRQERAPLAARLDAIDLAVENLSRVYGINGTPQALPLEEDDAITRRDSLLRLIRGAARGLTLPELRKATPAMAGKDRSNALQVLKAAKQIKRVKNAWKAA